MPTNASSWIYSDARHSFGSAVFYGAFPSINPTTGVATYPTTITEIGRGKFIEATINGRTLSDIKITHMKSMDGFHEYMPGIGEGGAFDLKFHYHPDFLEALESMVPVVGQLDPDRGRLTWWVTDSESNWMRCIGYIQPPDIEYKEDAPIAINVKLKVALGRPVFFVAE